MLGCSHIKSWEQHELQIFFAAASHLTELISSLTRIRCLRREKAETFTLRTREILVRTTLQKCNPLHSGFNNPNKQPSSRNPARWIQLNKSNKINPAVETQLNKSKGGDLSKTLIICHTIYAQFQSWSLSLYRDPLAPCTFRNKGTKCYCFLPLKGHTGVFSMLRLPGLVHVVNL